MASLNVQNWPKAGMEIALQGQEPVLFDVRACLQAPEGKQFIIGDLSQIEARVTPYLAGDDKTIQLIAEGMNVYEVHARLSLGFTGTNLKKEDKDLYALAKARVLALGFGCGWMRFRDQAQLIYGVGLDWEAAKWKEQVKDFRASNPKIVRLWNRLDQDFKSSVGGNYEMELPSGRIMTYFDVTAGTKVVKIENPNLTEPAEKARTGYKARVEIGGAFKWFYGGMLAENLVQATARDVFVEALLRIQDHRPDLQYLWQTHDEGVWLADENDGTAVKDVEELLSVTPEWLPGCPIGAEVGAQLTYEKLD